MLWHFDELCVSCRLDRHPAGIRKAGRGRILFLPDEDSAAGGWHPYCMSRMLTAGFVG